MPRFHYILGTSRREQEFQIPVLLRFTPTKRGSSSHHPKTQPYLSPLSVCSMVAGKPISRNRLNQKTSMSTWVLLRPANVQRVRCGKLFFSGEKRRQMLFPSFLRSV